MNLRLMTSDDIPAAMRLKDLAGWNQTAADWERFLAASPAGCFVAELEGRVCGTVTTIVYEGRFAWIGMVLVDPDYRGRGIGTRLLEGAIEHLDGLGVPTLKLDATPQGKPLYSKLGFVSEYEIERWTLKRPPPKDPSAPQMVRGQAMAEVPDLGAIAKLDRHVFGADRSAALNSLDDEAPEFTLAIDAAGELAAYALGRHGSRADHLGPWVAKDEASARSLLAEFVHRSKREHIFVDCMKSSSFACEFVRAMGFEFSRLLTRMYRGANHYPGTPEVVGAILGPEFG
ncbi:MAG TPA: GNAT family N-acetyltransferase [Terriglobia bacterium]|nr:GNAT family N-acetyltransferase [Terriglobia bacterium]